MTDSKTTIKVLLYEHNNEANALLRSDYNSLGTSLLRYLNFIDSEPLIKSFIDDCLREHLPEGFDADAEVTEVSKNYEAIFSFPPKYEAECAVVYLILKRIVERDLAQSVALIHPYGNGSRKYNDMTSGFLDEVARRLVNGIGRAITVEGIKSGLNANVTQTQINNFNNSGAAAAAQSSDHTSTNINQSSGIGGDELASIFASLEGSLSELSESDRIVASDAIAALKDALGEQKPKPSIVKSLWNIIRGINDGATFTGNVAKLGVFIAANFPGSIS